MRIIHSGLSIARVFHDTAPVFLPVQPLVAEQVRKLTGPSMAMLRHFIEEKVSKKSYGPRPLLKTTRRDQCRFIIEDENHIVCGQRTVKEKSYCDHHMQICTTGLRR